jgi:hypothetical protein
MNNVEEELEKRFLRLPNLKHIGMALLQFVHALDGKGNFVKKDTDWVFEPRKFVAFGFPKRGEKIRMHVDVDIPIDINEKDRGILELYSGHHYPVCEIKNARQLACAVRYIEGAFRKHLRKLGKPSDTTNI